METIEQPKDAVLNPNHTAIHTMQAYGPMPSRSFILDRIMKKYRGLDTPAMRSFMQGAAEVTESILLDFTRAPTQDWEVRVRMTSPLKTKIHNCTRCSTSLFSYYHYCPECGAKIKWL